MRECENCIHKKPEGCEKWTCEFEPIGWIPEDDRPKGNKWKCPFCGRTVYYPHFKGEKRCDYKFCPWCGKRIKV